MKKMKTILLFGILFFLFTTKVNAVTINISNAAVTNDEVTIEVSVSDLASNSCPNTKCFLQGMFTKSSDSPSYFGYTRNNSGDWYKYNGSPNPDYIKSTFFYFEPSNNTWSGSLTVKNDPEDSDYKGAGPYILRVKRYTGNSDSSTTEISNDLSINLSYSTPTPTKSNHFNDFFFLFNYLILL